MNVCAAHGLENEAVETFKEMCDAGFTPNLFHYSSLLNTYASKGRYEQAERVLLEIRAAGLTPNLVPPSSLLSSHLYTDTSRKWCYLLRLSCPK